ncbi:MAG: hypothetical protein WC254_03495 [Candidatus Woesearchaeota archaeon]|jgi:hypothetical protein
MEFNPDGSIKLPGNLAKQKQENEQRMQCQRCIKVRKEIISSYSPKKCALRITLSDAIKDNRFIQILYDEFKRRSSVPTKLNQNSDKEFDVEVGTDFRRCSDCCSLVNKYREFLDGNVIEEKGSCTFEGRKNMAYEDYFE